MPRIRLLTLGHSYVLSVNRRLAHEMARQGGDRWDVRVLAPADFIGRSDIRRQRFEALAGEAIHVDVVKARFTRYVHFFRYARPFARLVGGEFDLVHAWEEPYIMAGLQVARAVRPGTRLVYRTAQSISKRYPPPFTWVERYCTSRMSGWICSGKLVESTMLSRPGYSSRPHCLVPLGVDLEMFRLDPEAGAATRRSLGWDDSIPVIGFLGRLVREKGIHLLMKILDSLNTPWRALIVGNGPLEPALRQWALRHDDRVRVCTEVRHSNVPRYLNAMDLLVAPSETTVNWREQFGRMVIEAFACGVPVIGSDSGEIPHVVGDTGVICPEQDAFAWVRSLSNLLESADVRRTMAEAGIQRARSFSWVEVARRHLEFFERVLQSGPLGN